MATKQKQRQEQKVIINIHQDKPKKRKTKRKPKPKPNVNPFYPERIIVPQIQMRQNPNLDFNKLIDVLRKNNTSRVGNQRIQEPQAQLVLQREPVLAERVDNMPDPIDFVTTEELVKSGEARPANFGYFQNREADDFFKEQEESKKAEEEEYKRLIKKMEEDEAKKAEEPVEIGAGGGGRFDIPAAAEEPEEEQAEEPVRQKVKVTPEIKAQILDAEKKYKRDLRRLDNYQRNPEFESGFNPLDKTANQYKTNLKRSRRMLNYLLGQSNMDEITDEYDV